jgi:hypothetical protein
MSYRAMPTNATEPTEISRWAFGELTRVSLSLDDQNTLTVPLLNAAPDKPQTGQIVLADGTNWNPGSGRGLYYYDSTWKHIA